VRQVVGADLADPVVEMVAVETGPADEWSGGPGPGLRHGGVITRNRRHQHRDRARLRFRQRSHQTQQRAPTRRQTQHLGQARARPSCQRQPDRLQHGAQHRTATPYGTVRPGTCSAKVRASHFSLSQNSRRTRSRISVWAATDRRIIQPPLVSTVHPLGRTIAPWTHRRPGTDMAPKDDATTPRSIRSTATPQIPGQSLCATLARDRGSSAALVVHCVGGVLCLLLDVVSRGCPFVLDRCRGLDRGALH
jgi:hypothetical protein